jgi:simple sugar transport system substrate-binding protein
MPADVAALASQTEADLKSGKIAIFKGPIKEQGGTVKVAANVSLDDAAISGMNWLAEGVEGQIPK